MNENRTLELQSRAIQAVGTHARTQDCAELWSQLIRRKVEIVAEFTTEDRDYLVFRELKGEQEPLHGRSLEMLESVLTGVGRKTVGFELGLAASTIAQELKAALRRFGLTCLPGRVPPLLVVLAHAARGTPVRATTRAEFVFEAERCIALAIAVDSPLFRVLAPAERDVVRHLLHGRTYADIAAKRRTSSRTIANQIATACRRLGVSGRSDLVQLMARGQAAPVRVQSSPRASAQTRRTDLEPSDNPTT